MIDYYDFKVVTMKKYAHTSWRYQTGVFKTPQGKFITRVKKSTQRTATTIAQFNTVEEALLAYDTFYNTINHL